MAKKDQTTDEALSDGPALAEHTPDGPALAEHTPEDHGETSTVLIQRAVNRGSRRRIENAKTNFSKAFDEFVKEMDLQFFLADDGGNRVAPWAGIADLRTMKAGIFRGVDGLMSENLAVVQEMEAGRPAKSADARSERVARAKLRKQGAVPGNETGGTDPADPSKNQ